MGDRQRQFRDVCVMTLEPGADRAWDVLLADGLARAVLEPRTRALVFMIGPDAAPRLAPEPDLSRLGRLGWLMREAPLPLVMGFAGVLTGPALALGLMVDGLVAARRACLIRPHADADPVELGALAARLAARIGAARAREFVLLGAPLPAAMARKWGLLDAVVDEGRLVEACVRLARTLIGDWEGVSAWRRGRCPVLSSETGMA